jgi:hypothetical protein
MLVSKTIPASDDKTLNISALASNIYFITITNIKGQAQTQKFVIE